MKLLIKCSLLVALLISVFGGASTDGTYETRLAPPEDFNPTFMEYKKLPGQKVMVIAIDPGGYWAYGYDHGRSNTREAAEAAAIKCDDARKQYVVHNKAKIFAINNDIIYYDQFKK